MVKAVEKYYECDFCRLKYKDKETARKCEEWCSKHRSCNTEIAKEAVK